jgi:hypothetical protein
MNPTTKPPAPSGGLEINIPEVLQEVEAAFARYEDALVSNDITVLDELFWDSPNTLRYGSTENLYGMTSIRAFRHSRAPQTVRTLGPTVITTFGRDCGTANTEFRRVGTERVGRQSQTWVRMPEGWRVVAAHVSFLS